MFSDPQFWVAVSFVIFIIAIFNPVKKILTSNLDLQIDEIKSKISNAENLKNEAEKTLKELKLREVQVEEEIELLKKNADEKIMQLKEISLKKLDEQINKRKILAENKIEQILRDTNESMKNYISNVAIYTTMDILKNKLTKENKSVLIDKSIKELNNILKN